MLETLFKNKNVEQILLFLFVNQKGYDFQIKSLLNVLPTSLKQTLYKLEKDKVIHSYFEKNRRVYEFNFNYPLFNELESLLKKNYTLLLPEDKKKYCLLHKPRLNIKEEVKRDLFQEKELKEFFKRLSNVGTLLLKTSSRNGGEQKTQKGHALVLISSTKENELIFTEKGNWDLGLTPSLAFTNSFRWTLDLKSSLISLEHLRYGLDKPVFLFHLTPNESKELDSISPHICNEDTYLGKVRWSENQVLLDLRVIGPNKNDFLNYIYE